MPAPTSALPCLFALAGGLGAQVAPSKGGGSLTLGKDLYQFRFDAVNLAPAQPRLKLPRAFVLRGKLVPTQGTPLVFELTALEDGRIYGLSIVRKRPNGAVEERWAATLKTKVDVLELVAQAGGRVKVALSGTLSTAAGAVIPWKGELWGTFESVPL